MARARRRAGTRARSDVWAHAEEEADLTLRLPGGVPMFFRRIPAGSFLMGSRGMGADEEPRHRVVITRDFYLGTFLVTQAQYRAVAASCPALASRPTPSHFKGPRRPVEQVSWDDAEEFLRWLTAWPELPPGIACARLPTEAEWEYACRAGTETDYYTGDGEAALAGVGWYDANAGETTHAVDERPERHPWGLYGMHGNVWEWCGDWYDPAAYRKRVDGVCDPEVREQGESRGRVQRGGSWVNVALGCRSAFRYWNWPGDRFGGFGFRVCLVRSPAAEGEEAEPGRGDGAPRDEAAESDRGGGAGGRDVRVATVTPEAIRSKQR